MKYSKLNQILINQGNHSAGNAIPLGNNVLSFTVKNLPQSGSNVYVGLNEDAGPGNVLEPDGSYTHVTKEGYYSDDTLYLTFDETTTGGIALIVIDRDTNKEVC